MKLNGIDFIIFLLVCLLIEGNLGQEAVEVNTHYIELREGHGLKLTCKHNVDSSFVGVWIPPISVPHDKYTVDIKDGNVFTLTIKNAKREYAGKYTCKLHPRNAYGEGVHELIEEFHVGVKPVVKLLVDGHDIMNNSNNLIKRSGKAIITCKEGDATYPKPVYEWRKNEEILEDEDEEDFTVTESGIYTCKLANSIGSKERTAYIIIEVCTDTVICRIGFIFSIISFVIAAIYSIIYFYKSIKDREFTRNIKLIVPLVLVLILLITLIIVHLSLNCEMIGLCIVNIICGILSVIIVAVNVYRYCKNDQPPIEKTKKFHAVVLNNNEDGNCSA